MYQCAINLMDYAVIIAGVLHTDRRAAKRPRARS